MTFCICALYYYFFVKLLDDENSHLPEDFKLKQAQAAKVINI